MRGKKTVRLGLLKFILLSFMAAGLAIFFAAATDTTLRTVRYELVSDKIKTAVRLAVLTDLHSASYGEGQAGLLVALEEQQPDAVFFVGDIFDERFPAAPAVTAISEAAQRFPTYYVSGNHEYKRFRGKPHQAELFKTLAAEAGAVVLQGNCVTFRQERSSGEAGDLEGSIKICGVDDPLLLGRSALKAQLGQAAAHLSPADFSVLLAHRPELLETYDDFGFDLVVAGHAHGGQWRLPGLTEGLYAPGQGLFPKYTGGKYFSEKTTLVLSRGLGKNATLVPRIFNPVEVVIVDVLPAKTALGRQPEP